jgi:hypothetical protein
VQHPDFGAHTDHSMHHSHQEGTDMTTTDHRSKAAHSTGLFAVLRGLLHARGSGAPSVRFVLAGVVPILAAIGLVVGAAPALANSGYALSKAFGTMGSGAGQLELAYEGQLKLPSKSGVAVNDSTHNVYVADTDNHRIDEFEADGSFMRAWGWGVADGLSMFETCGPDAFPPTAVCQRGLPGHEPGQLGAPSYIAVDNSSGVSHGDVYVGTGVGGKAENEEQEIGASVTGTPAAGGTYTLTFEGETTEPIAIAHRVEGSGSPEAGGSKEALEAAQVALEKLPKIGKGNVEVASKLQGTYGEVEFVGALAEKAVPQLTAAATALSPERATFEVRTIQEGSPFVQETISKFTAEGKLEESWGGKGQFDGATAPNPFSKLDGIAVDTAGDLWVYLDDPSEHVVELEQSDGFIQEWPIPDGHGFGIPSTDRSIAVDGGGDIYLSSKAGVNKFTATGEPLPSGASAGPVTGLAANQASNNIYVDRGTSIEDLGSSGGVVSTFDSQQLGLGGGAGLTVDSTSATVYAVNASTNQVETYGVALEVNSKPATGVTTTMATLDGEVNPKSGRVVECYFELGTGTEYEETAACEHPDATEIGEGSSAVPVHARIVGLRGGTAYHFHLVAVHESLLTHETTAVSGEDEAFATPTIPVLASEEAVDLTATGAELRASVNPEGLQVTSCKFEYGTSTSYGEIATCEQKKPAIGAGSEPVPVSAKLTELQANTEYHWRLVVKDINGEGISPDHTFVYPTSGPELPDQRAYEMVSPVEKNGGLIGDTFAGFEPQVSAAGSRIIALDIQCFSPAESCNAARQTIGEPIEITRSDEGQTCAPAAPPCWATSALAPPAARFSENTPWAVSANAGTALFSMPTGSASEDEWYARSTAGSFGAIGPVTPPGITGVNRFGLTNKEMTADLSHLVWELDTNQGPPWPFDKTTKGNSLYEYVGTGNKEPFLVGVTGESGSTELIGTCGAVLGAGGNGVQLNPLSADGRTVYFTTEIVPNGGPDGSPCPEGTGTNAGKEVPVREVYARVGGEDPGVAHTVALSEPQALAPVRREECQSVSCRENTSIANESSDWRSATFVGASEDGSAAFFASEQQLTDNAAQGSENLYESLCTQGCETSEEQRRLIDVSAVAEHVKAAGGGAGVQGVMAISTDGSHVYFVANGVLASGARLGDCHEGSRAGRCDLYVYERDARYPEGHIALITSLPATDAAQEGEPDWPEINGGGVGPANVTPDGRFLVFVSHGDLTSDAHSGGSNQIFRYDAESGELVRVSGGDDGFDDDGNKGTGEATIVPAAVYTGNGPARGDPTMSDDGAYVFFQSPRALTPHALADVVIGHSEAGQVQYAQNVYEYHEGRVYLISDGRDAGTASTSCGGAGARVNTSTELFQSSVCLLGTDVTGHDVFFMTADQLVPKDTDTQVDIYDARICEPEHGNPCISEPSPPLPTCGGEACHGIPAATPSLLTPGSASFDGEGNVASTPPALVVRPKAKVVTCKKGFVKNKKRKCVKKKDKKKAKRSRTNRRAK